MSFSGYLSYNELFPQICKATELGLGSCTDVLTIPACVYGFGMYLIVFFLSLKGLKNEKTN